MMTLDDLDIPLQIVKKLIEDAIIEETIPDVIINEIGCRGPCEFVTFTAKDVVLGQTAAGEPRLMLTLTPECVESDCDDDEEDDTDE